MRPWSAVAASGTPCLLSPIAEKNRPVAVARGFLTVRLHDHRATVFLVDPLEQRQDGFAIFGIEIARLVVGEKNRRIERERPRHGDALDLATRKFLREMVLPFV